ncbi:MULTISPECIES: methylated-DNA--[protein]-cysteine S-methyltransferase [Microbacterium]|uniref:methylated-DNA--[protein]-cysteine S-methyltransferase n=1 Tax=Microbacterium TaxID=33882 RepID=UPI002788EA11|nr:MULTISPECIES: methylated-DNA--[protein]-cysteine S-methyltransferase [Microbacterium]MDQ1083155.1 methylated-DNA-[protein]-cysteine S-methyltransferase [Microbacterium sp. SORGH_AS_0344]MDQ1171570.1 methylated-DNA-[protein]-cysteine S-methyltransferase [Microbacterium proteolyticum]
MTTATLQFVDTPDGPFAILADDADRVIVSGWTSDPDAVLGRLRPDRRPTEVSPGETSAADAVLAYYGGDIRAIDDVPVVQHGTTMQLAGWRALRAIAPGAPLTYTGFATALGSPSAVRAAASVCARNAVALFVPCHRVLRGDGTMGGFAWGTEVKQSLLARESAG